jgi:hypothetical protein
MPPSRRFRYRISAQVRLTGALAAVGLLFLIWLGSERLHQYDSALVGYMVAIVALTFAVVARYARWLRMPSTRRYWRSGWALVASPSTFRKLPALLPKAVAGQLLGQGFIRRRGVVRWIGHQCLFWGVIGATLITFPLVFGWLAFRLAPGSVDRYQVWVFGFATVTIPTDGFIGWSTYHALDYTAVLVIIGCSIFLWRRFRDRGLLSTQSLAYDLAPLILLMAISVTGLLLTVDSMYLHGTHYEVMSVVHMAVVVFSLVFIPFGKFFHVLQRPASVGIQMYTEVNARAGLQACSECGEPLASPVFLGDLQDTLHELGQDYALDDLHVAGAAGGRPPLPEFLTDLCPRCRRVSRGRAFFDQNGRSFAR